jgi:hypothetical protein
MEGALGHTLEFTQFARVCEAHRFDLRFFRPFRADLSIRKSSSFLPPLIAATSNEVSRHDLFDHLVGAGMGATRNISLCTFL